MIWNLTGGDMMLMILFWWAIVLLTLALLAWMADHMFPGENDDDDENDERGNEGWLSQ